MVQLRLVITLVLAVAPQRYTPPAADIAPVEVESGCTADARHEVNRGAAWLLVLAPGEAGRAFERASEADPDCAVAYWGQAASRFPVADERLEPGGVADIERLAARARAVKAPSAAGQALVDALDAGFTRLRDSASPRARLVAYRERLCEASASQPANAALSLFCARAALATSTLPGDAPAAQAIRLAGGATGAKDLGAGAAVVVLQAADAGSAEARGAADRLLALGPPSALAMHLALRAFVRHGAWQKAVAAGERAHAAAGATGAFGLLYGSRGEYVPEWLLEAYLQQGRLEAARAFVRRAAEGLPLLDAIGADPRAGAVRHAVARMRARTTLAAELAAQARDDASPAPLPGAAWPVAFATGLSAAIRAWPGGDAARLEAARAALPLLAGDGSGRNDVSEQAWAAALIEAAIAASQDEHPQMALLFSHAIALEARLRESGRLALPLVPAGELAAELWLRTYRYQDAQREARAVLDTYPERVRCWLTIGRAAVRLGQAAEARAAFDRVALLRRQADADDRLRAEAAAFLSK